MPHHHHNYATPLFCLHYHLVIFQDHIENVEKTRLTLEMQTDEVRSAIEEKLKTAEQQRDDNIKKMLDRLKEHVSYIM